MDTSWTRTYWKVLRIIDGRINSGCYDETQVYSVPMQCHVCAEPDGFRWQCLVKGSFIQVEVIDEVVAYRSKKGTKNDVEKGNVVTKELTKHKNKDGSGDELANPAFEKEYEKKKTNSQKGKGCGKGGRKGAIGTY